MNGMEDLCMDDGLRIAKSQNQFETQPKNHGKFGSRGDKALKKLFDLYSSFLSENNKEFISEKCSKCETRTNTVKSLVSGKEYTGTFYEAPNRQNKKLKNNGYEKELFFATILASKGFLVYLIDEPSIGGKKIDAIVNGIPVDFKKSETESENSLKKNYQKGMDKAHSKGVIVHFENKFSFNIDDFSEGITKHDDNGILSIWVESEDEFYNYDMKKIRESHESNSQKIGTP